MYKKVQLHHNYNANTWNGKWRIPIAVDLPRPLTSARSAIGEGYAYETPLCVYLPHIGDPGATSVAGGISSLRSML